jgi:hypothetical protein
VEILGEVLGAAKDRGVQSLLLFIPGTFDEALKARLLPHQGQRDVPILPRDAGASFVHRQHRVAV